MKLLKNKIQIDAISVTMLLTLLLLGAAAKADEIRFLQGAAPLIGPEAISAINAVLAVKNQESVEQFFQNNKRIASVDVSNSHDGSTIYSFHAARSSPMRPAGPPLLIKETESCPSADANKPTPADGFVGCTYNYSSSFENSGN